MHNPKQRAELHERRRQQYESKLEHDASQLTSIDEFPEELDAADAVEEPARSAVGSEWQYASWETKWSQ